MFYEPLHHEVRAFNAGRNRHFNDNPSDGELLRRFSELEKQPVSDWNSDDYQLEAFVCELNNFRMCGGLED